MTRGKDLYSVILLDKAREILAGLPGPNAVEVVEVKQAAGRILAETVLSPESLPAWARSNMDGFAVRAADTYGASEGLPAFLDVIGSVAMGEAPQIEVGVKQAVGIATGGMLPDGADAVVMVEYTEPAGSGIEISRPVAPGENVVQPGEDFAAGEAVAEAGTELHASNLASLHAFGVLNALVGAKPKIYIVSTGDELVSPEIHPKPGQIRDINTTALAASVEEDGGVVVGQARVGDDRQALSQILTDAVARADVVIVSGGSSVSTHDFTAESIDILGKPGVLAHGVAMTPGKPTIIGYAQDTFIFGLSGHPSAALVVYNVLIKPLLWRLQGGREIDYERKRRFLAATLDRNLVSKSGRTDFIRVSLREDAGRIMATPIFGSSGLIMTLAKADGTIEVPDFKEGLSKGHEVVVELW